MCFYFSCNSSSWIFRLPLFHLFHLILTSLCSLLALLFMSCYFGIALQCFHHHLFGGFLMERWRMHDFLLNTYLISKGFLTFFSIQFRLVNTCKLQCYIYLNGHGNNNVLLECFVRIKCNRQYSMEHEIHKIYPN